MKSPTPSPAIETALTSSKLPDPTMKLFTAIAMVLVVVGHVDYTGFMGPFNLFPPYSFQVASFVFVSGYFCKEQVELTPMTYISRKVRHLIIPLYLIMAAYGVIAFVLLQLGFEWGQSHSLSSFIVEPLTNGHQFIINMPMWFLGPLFCAEIINLAIRKMIPPFKATSKRKEIILFIAYLSLGAIAVAEGGGEGIGPSWKLFACRSLLFFLACLGMGRFYKCVLEQHDNLNSTIYFSIVIALQLILFSLCGARISYVPSWCRFPNGVLLTYLVTFTGIAFLLRISKIFGVRIGNSGPISAVADNTFSIMCHHYFAFFLISLTFGGLSLITPFFPTFDWRQFHSIHYLYYPFGQACWAALYSVFGITFSLFIHRIWMRLKSLLD